MLNDLILLIYHAICGLRGTGINFVASVSWSSTLLMSGSLQQNINDATINEWRKRLRARVHLDRKHFEHLLWASYQTEKSWTNNVQLIMFISNKIFLYSWVCDFQGLKVSQGKVHTLSRWGRKLNHLLVAYLLGNINTKNYWIWTTTVKIIVGGWVVYYFGDTVYWNA